MELAWHGHSCFEIRGSRAVVLDPHDGRSLGIPPPSATADFVFVSHNHFDHNATRLVRGNPRVVDDRVDGRVDGMAVETLILPHDDVGGEKRGLVRAYQLHLDGMTFLHLGDVGAGPDAVELGNEEQVSVLFVPVGGVFTVGPKEAVEWVEALQPEVVVPMHYRVGGLSLSIRPVEEFLSLTSRPIHRLGQAVSFQPGDLEGEPKVWVFSY
ncbi:MAG: MBL fold metallo-hydrolase [Candidatus Thermoplasmatota archaeon]|nr:MBL fold metallo-hydrolase [Candidatus Thermoplasmatota archaeon]